MPWNLLLLLLSTFGLAAQPDPDGESLRLLISVERSVITAPYPVRVTLHLHNAGSEAVWIYRRVRDRAINGSELEVSLKPILEAGSGEVAEAADATVFESVGLPRPGLVKLAAGDDYSEKATLKIVPAHFDSGGARRPIWGRYRLSVTYRARFSNADFIQRVLGVELWQAEITSNTVEIELQPPTGEGTIAGRVTGKENQPLDAVLVTLSDSEERLVDQTQTGFDGHFSFDRLAFGMYWVTVRRLAFTEDTTLFRHLELTPTEPDGTIEFLLLPPEVHQPDRLLHKPVLFLITDTAGQRLDKVRMDVTWSSGTVLEGVKGESDDEGIIVLDLIGGRNYVALKRRGCSKLEQRVDVAPGEGIDGFKLEMACRSD